MEPPDNSSRPRKPWVAWTLLALGAIERLVGWGGSVDFVLTRWNEPAWVGDVLNAILEYSNLIGLALLVGGFALLIRNERKRNDARYGRDRDEAAPRARLAPEPTPSGDTLRATGTVSDPTPEAALERLLHTGYILASVDKLKDGGFIELCLVAYNASAKTLILSDIRGNPRITLKEGDQEIKEKLGVPDLIRIAPKRQIPPFSEFVLTLHQVVGDRLALLIRGAMRKQGATLDFENLTLEFEPYREPGPKARLKLWDGVSIKDSGPRFSRVMMLRAEGPLIGGQTTGDEQ